LREVGVIEEESDSVAGDRPVRLFDLDDYTVAAFTAVAAMAVYLRTLAPTVTGEDSGELIAAAYTLGIPHPTGYPLWCILANLFIDAVPFNSIAWRVALMSAFFSAATVYVVTLLIIKLTRNRWAAVAGALSLAFSLEFWEQSVIAEVYSLNAYLTALCILLVLRWQDERRPGLLIACGFCFGLALCNHSIIALAGPIIAVYVLATGGLSREYLRVYARSIAAVCVGLLIHLYLPLRSMSNPAMDWGNPETFDNFWDVVTRAQYTFIMTDGPRSFPRFLEQLRVFAGIYSQQFTPGIGWLAPIGMLLLLRKRPGPCILLATLFLVFAIGAILIPNFGFDRMAIWINTTYWIPAYLVAAIFIGVVIATVSSLPSRRTVQRVIAIVLTVTAAAVPLATHFQQNNKNDYYFVDDYSRNVINTLAPGAIYFGDSDHALFSVMYLQIVEGLRPDVTVANPYGYPVESVYSAMPNETKARFEKLPSEADERFIFEWLVRESGRPVYSTAKRTVKGAVTSNAGLLYRYTAPGSEVNQPPTWNAYTWHTLDEKDVHGDWTAELILFDVHFARGRTLLDEGLREQGIEAFDEAARFSRNDVFGLNNLGSAAAEYGLNKKAIEYLTAACELDPRFVVARRNLGKAYLRDGQVRKALDQFEIVLTIAPDDTTTQQLRAHCEQQLRS
jgi:tetratricopeptide (TPR) repeat protein